MDITSVKITLSPGGEGHLKAYASITLDNCFVVHDLKIIRTNDKFFVAMPSKAVPGKPTADGGGGDKSDKTRFRDIAHPLNADTRAMIQKAVFIEYEKTLEEFKLDQPRPGAKKPDKP